MDILEHLRSRSGPVRVADQHPRRTVVARMNTRVGVAITRIVGTMWTAWAFAALALISLPAAIASHSAITIVSWIAQTFFQLVLLPIIMVGQNAQGAASDKRAQQTYEDAEAILHGQSQLIDLTSSLHSRLDAMGRNAAA